MRARARTDPESPHPLPDSNSHPLSETPPILAECCRQFTMDVGRGVGLERVEEKVQSEVSEAELQERELREEAEMLEADEQGRDRG